MVKNTEGNLYIFAYRNYRGEISERRVHIHCLEYLLDPGFNYKPGWFLSGFDVDKQARRSFALDNIMRPLGSIRFSIPDTWNK